MAPVKFEQQIKEKFDERTIKPSDKAWSSISDTLDTHQKPKKNSILWYSVAASFIGLLSISIWYLGNGEKELDSDQVVKVPQTEHIKEAPEPILGTNKKNPVEKEQIKAVMAPTSIKEELTEIQTISAPNEQQRLSKQILQGSKNVEPLEEQVAENKEKSLGEDTEKIIDSKIAEVVAQVNLLEKSNTEVTDAEVDSILRRAQKDILTNKLFRKDQTVDHVALLAEAEDELDQSFRDQIFESLKSGFIKVRTAVADRNN
ncbi:hypothetical protein [Spongiimicrobium sp. 3-5]|uniref:hypothetical protein n=1 Tax=Spongiimicrobium sp. 3-5 TaxID=3332596 RepID=UPI00397F2340